MPDLFGKRALVTGAAGFIGANVVRGLLESGAKVTGLVRPDGDLAPLSEVEDRMELIPAEIRDPGAVEEAVASARPELAVNLACSGGHPETREERLTQLEVSVLGTARLVEALALSGCMRLVHVGSSLEYGSKPEPMREEDVLSPVVPRGAAKAAATLVCLVWARTLGVPALVLRPFSVYGPGEDERRLVPSALRAALDATELPLTEPGIGRDFVYVGDVVDAILLGLTARGVDGQIVNIGSGVQTTNEELVATVGRIVGREVRARPGTHRLLAHDTRSWVADIERARHVLGWSPSTRLEEGLRRTLASLETRVPSGRS